MGKSLLLALFFSADVLVAGGYFGWPKWVALLIVVWSFCVALFIGAALDTQEYEPLDGEEEGW